MVHHWSKAIDDDQSVRADRAAFINFAKEFDHVDHNVLVCTLPAFGLPDTIIRWMCACRRQRVKIGKVLSEWLKIDVSMVQGSFLGPLTFVILTDDL